MSRDLLARSHGKPLPASNITPAAVFRSIDRDTPTLLIDEADTFLERNDDLRGILNSGHDRSGAYVVRTVGDDYVPHRFSTWAPIIIAKIGILPDTLNDRSITILLHRKKPCDTVERFRADKGSFRTLRCKIARWVSDASQRLERWDGPLPHELHDRAADNWRPLIAIADAIGGDWPDVARRAARALTAKEDEGSHSVLILSDIRSIFEETKSDRLTTNTIVDRLRLMEDRPWSEYRQGRPTTASQLARCLRPFGIRPRTIRLDDGETSKGYMLSWFEDTFARYLPPQDVTPSQTNERNDLRAGGGVTVPEDVTGKIGSEGPKNQARDAVTARDEIEVRQNDDPEIPGFLLRLPLKRVVA